MTNKAKHSALFRGFVAGFTSPFLVFSRRPLHLSYRRYDTMKKAWREVGAELAEATEAEGKRIGKVASTKDRKLVFH